MELELRCCSSFLYFSTDSTTLVTLTSHHKDFFGGGSQDLVSLPVNARTERTISDMMVQFSTRASKESSILNHTFVRT